MKRVMQRIVDKDRGDCQTAAAASILDLDYEQVPTWCADAYDRGQPHEDFHDMTRWFEGRGLHLLTVSWRGLCDWRGLVGALCIASMPSQRFAGGAHAVVGSWRARGDGGHQFFILHDPNPLNEPYPLTTNPERVSFLVPLAPGEWTRQARSA